MTDLAEESLNFASDVVYDYGLVEVKEEPYDVYSEEQAENFHDVADDSSENPHINDLHNGSEDVKVELVDFYNKVETEVHQDISNDSTVMPTENVLNDSLDGVKLEPDDLSSFGDSKQLKVTPANSDSVQNVENSGKPLKKKSSLMK